MDVMEIFYAISLAAILVAAISGSFSFLIWEDQKVSKKSYLLKRLGVLSLAFYVIAFISLLVLYAGRLPNFQLGLLWKIGILILGIILFIAAGVIWWRVVKEFSKKPQKPKYRTLPPFFLLFCVFITLLGMEFWIDLFFGAGS